MICLSVSVMARRDRSVFAWPRQRSAPGGDIVSRPRLTVCLPQREIATPRHGSARTTPTDDRGAHRHLGAPRLRQRLPRVDELARLLARQSRRMEGRLQRAPARVWGLVLLPGRGLSDASHHRCRLGDQARGGDMGPAHAHVGVSRHLAALPRRIRPRPPVRRLDVRRLPRRGCVRSSQHTCPLGP